MGICGRGRGAPDSRRLGCPIGSVSYTHSSPAQRTPLSRHIAGAPGQRQSQRRRGKSVPSREEIRGCPTSPRRGKRSCPRLRRSAWLSLPREGSGPGASPPRLRGLREGGAPRRRQRAPAPQALPAFGTAAAAGALPF